MTLWLLTMDGTTSVGSEMLTLTLGTHNSHVLFQVLGGGSRKIITLSHRSQLKRFTSDLLRILKSQACKQIGVLELPVVYSKLLYILYGSCWYFMVSSNITV